MGKVNVYKGSKRIGYTVIADTDTKRFTITDRDGNIIGDNKVYLWQAIECILMHWLYAPKRERISSFKKKGIMYDEMDIHAALATDVAHTMFYGKHIA